MTRPSEGARVPEWHHYAMVSQQSLYDLAVCADCDYSVRERLRMIAESQVTSRNNHASFGHGELLGLLMVLGVDKTTGEVVPVRIHPSSLDAAILSAVDRGDLYPGSMRSCLIVPPMDLVLPHDKQTGNFAKWKVECPDQPKHTARRKTQIAQLATAAGSDMRRRRRPWARTIGATGQEAGDG